MPFRGSVPVPTLDDVRVGHSGPPNPSHLDPARDGLTARAGKYHSQIGRLYPVFSSSSGLIGNYLSATTSSFTEFVSQMSPDVLPHAVQEELAPHGTTIVASTFCGGVVMAGDRRATMGSMIAKRDIEKVFSADEFSVIGIAGVAGLAVELVRLFQVELEHFEKIEGMALSLDGKANRLATMIRGNLGLAMQGLGVLPLFAGWDERAGAGRIFSYDATGGRYEETGFHALGSGGVFAKGSLRKTFLPNMNERAAAACLLQALFDAADEDSATGGPDTARRIYPIVFSVTAAGARRFSTDQVAELCAEVMPS